MCTRARWRDKNKVFLCYGQGVALARSEKSPDRDVRSFDLDLDLDSESQNRGKKKP